MENKMAEVRFPQNNADLLGSKSVKLVDAMYAMANRFDAEYGALCREQQRHGIEHSPRGQLACAPRGNSDEAILEEFLRIQNLFVQTRIKLLTLRFGSQQAHTIVALELLEANRSIGIMK